ncbi:HpcH/HpaI aldolase family protein [Sphingobium boeckii]|uniref:4-hydroxy-2-oxoheptanedioate aldolase n=1 Tax=Sphingobium boeckii TaxID=1082345 RepID=A0A7W9ALN9_9SPHN|nr:aldolase/citrate lyase family protein [Sphingobium boeckii]MBB5687747.1 4-hydroxy-2-oxoheptanedioate aldolase [Sphingobium boeckii]
MEIDLASTRLNGVIRQLEAGKPAFTSFIYAEKESAITFSQSPNDGVIFELEHNPWDISALRDSLQFMLNRRQMVQSGSLAPKVTPMARIPASGDEKNQWFAKQALDLGCYGIVWPRISTVDQAYHAVAACRYARLQDKPLYHPAGLRGDGPMAAARYWGLTQQEYYRKADVWPLNPEGEILVILMIEDTKGIENLDAILSQVPGVGVVLFGEGDLSQELGVPRQYDHPLVLDALAEVRRICKRHNVAIGHPHVNANNVERLLDEGFNFLMTFPLRDFSAINKGIAYAGSHTG